MSKNRYRKRDKQRGKNREQHNLSPPFALQATGYGDSAADKAQKHAKDAKAEIKPAQPSWFRRKMPWLFAPTITDWITVLCTVVIAVCTFFYTRYARYQWETMSGQLKEMKSKETLRVQQRPWLGSLTGGFFGKLTDNGVLGYGTQFMNTGHSAATRIVLRQGTSFVDEGVETVLEGDAESFQGAVAPGGFLPVGGKLHLTRQQADAVRKGTATIRAWGVLKYSDSYETAGEVGYCYLLVSNESKLCPDRERNYSK